MSRWAGRCLLAGLAVLAILLLAPAARATSIPPPSIQCLPEPLVSLPSEPDRQAVPLAGEEDLCDGGLVIQGPDEVPICLLEGASAVAPPPHPVMRTAIVEAGGAGTCTPLAAMAELSSPHQDDLLKAPVGPSHALAALDGPLAPPPALVALLSAMPSQDGAGTAHALGVYRPPRRGGAPAR
jgi:hypothetical protein